MFFERRPLYEWTIENVEAPSNPRQIEFARLSAGAQQSASAGGAEPAEETKGGGSRRLSELGDVHLPGASRNRAEQSNTCIYK